MPASLCLSILECEERLVGCLWMPKACSESVESYTYGVLLVCGEEVPFVLHRMEEQDHH